MNNDLFLKFCTSCDKKTMHRIQTDNNGSLVICDRCDNINDCIDSDEIRIGNVEFVATKEVVKSGNGGIVYVPKQYIGRMAKVVIIIDDPRPKI